MEKNYFEKLSSKIKAYETEAIQLRHELHKIPEPGFKEYKTQVFIIDYLEALGYQPEKVCGTGVILYIPATKGGMDETIAIRTDMDGLSVVEKTGLDFCSSHEGMMHACGHDGHITMVLLLAKYLKEHPEDCVRNMLLIFQPAEEGPGGAEPIIESGALNAYDIKGVFGSHLFPFLEEGMISSVPGPMMAMNSEFYIDILGKSGHAAEPDKGVDAIVAAADYISSLQKIVSRNISPNDSALLSIGTIEGGARINVIAEKVSITGTLRSFSKTVQKTIEQRIVDMAEGIEKMYQCKINIHFEEMYPPVVNDPHLFEQIWPLFTEGKSIFKKMMISEDFSMYQRIAPSVFMGIGCGNKAKGFTENLHTNGFNFDEKVLLKGLDTYLKILTRTEKYSD